MTIVQGKTTTPLAQRPPCRRPVQCALRKPVHPHEHVPVKLVPKSLARGASDLCGVVFHVAIRVLDVVKVVSEHGICNLAVRRQHKGCQAVAHRVVALPQVAVAEADSTRRPSNVRHISVESKAISKLSNRARLARSTARSRSRRACHWRHARTGTRAGLCMQTWLP